MRLATIGRTLGAGALATLLAAVIAADGDGQGPRRQRLAYAVFDIRVAFFCVGVHDVGFTLVRDGAT